MSISQEVSGVASRRHDLDALRAFAMLLGIALHAALSFFPNPWSVQDIRQNELFGYFTSAIHGFRMPLFFLISGFFTMMLYRKRGLKSLFRQRAVRILLPCLIGLVTIVPLMRVVNVWAMTSAVKRIQFEENTLIAAIRAGNEQAIGGFLDQHADVNAPDPSVGVTPLSWATLKGDVDTMKRLLEHGADLNRKNRDGSTALHSAAFLGRDRAAELLIASGADTSIRSNDGDTPIKAASVDWDVTAFIVDLIGLPRPDRSQLEEERGRVRRLLEKVAPPRPDTSTERVGEATGPVQSLLEGYQRWIDSDRFVVTLGGTPFNLIKSNVFDHLWFLWFLCWLVPLFGLVVWCRSLVGGNRSAEQPARSSGRLLWLIPLTLIPQWVMGWTYPQFGPDTCTGLILLPHVFLYYSVFFCFGALYHDADDVDGGIGRHWLWYLPVGLLVLFPLGMSNLGNRPISATVQVLYAWVMAFGMMGLFRVLVKEETRWVRYLSDASYWLYLTHLPLVIVAQVLVRPWPWPATAKFLLITILSILFLLVVYQLFVRYTWIGFILNGPRRRASSRRPVASPT